MEETSCRWSQQHHGINRPRAHRFQVGIGPAHDGIDQQRATVLDHRVGIGAVLLQMPEPVRGKDGFKAGGGHEK